MSTKKGLSFKKKLKIYTTVFLTIYYSILDDDTMLSLKKNNLNLQKKDKFCRILPIDLAFHTNYWEISRNYANHGTMQKVFPIPGTEKKPFKSGPFNTFHHLQRHDYAAKRVPSSSVKDRSQLHPLAEGSIRKKTQPHLIPIPFFVTDLSDGWWFPLHPQPSETRKSHHVSEKNPACREAWVSSWHWRKRKVRWTIWCKQAIPLVNDRIPGRWRSFWAQVS